jgi:UDP-N-acetylglucosamine enolpyruvyl transferase
MPVIGDGPWPQFATDQMSCMITLATQVEGNVLFFEKMFESRLYFVDRLIAMGANAVVCDPHRVVISGKSRLRGTTHGVTRHPRGHGPAGRCTVRHRQVDGAKCQHDRARL